jgi:hypothetical protein
MNATSRKFKNEKKKCKCWKLFWFVVGSFEHFQSYGVHNSMSVKSAIKKL